ncbi:MAG TPA: glycolate oxidase subunit GlcF [Steroidobacteraceae bacterium]|nr:glycolate oxidase subunit GlcF [Steroidobacteraceae bacterium]
MQTHLADWIKDTPQGREADAILRACVHCGYCTATCPTYLLLGDELDGPRGRIYLIKQVLEGGPATAKTQLHLDRCLTCQSCETTCPSGVRYGRLLEIGREVVDERVKRGVASRALRALLRAGLTGRVFAPAYRLGQALRSFLPERVRQNLMPRQRPAEWPTGQHVRRVVMPEGCVQSAMSPNINAATARVLDRIGIEVVRPPGRSGCCGAVRQHLGDGPGALEELRRNIDAWWPAIEAGAEAIIMNASGCGVMVKDYGHLLRTDSRYAAKAARVSALARDVSEVLVPVAGALAPRMTRRGATRIVFHPPCTLQHGQKLPGIAEGLLRSLGVELLPFKEPHLCCGSAGTYSVLQSALAGRLRDRKLANLEAPRPDMILSANIGCIAHLAAGTRTPVRHWIEWLDAALA